MNDFSPVNLHDFEGEARRLLPKPAYDFFAGGATDEVTLRENRRAFDQLELHYRVLSGTAQRDLTTSLLGCRLSMPVLIAPTGFHKLAHPEGELATARAAAECGVPLVASTMSNVTLEEIRAAAPGPLWFQLYVYRDREVTRSLVERAEAAGFNALQVTVDLPVLGRREADIRNGFGLPPGLRIANLEGTAMEALGAVAGDSGVNAYTNRMLDSALNWRDIEWLRGLTKLPVLVKGVIRADDALQALKSGAAGVVISNHGGRQLDGSPATIRVLPEIAEALDGRGVLLLDGGVRRGTDIVKALALGAHAVQIGRPALWGLAVGGQAGVVRVLQLLKEELDSALALCGCHSARSVPHDLVRRR